jgi:hypothetical protein
MRQFFRHAIATILVLFVPALIIAAIPLLNGFGSTKVKASLVQEGTYTTLSSTAQSYAANLSFGEAESPINIGALIQQELTPTYVQTKTESMIDQTDAWVTGKSVAPPTLSFNDLRDQVLAKNPLAQGQLTEFQSYIQQAQADPALLEQLGGQNPEAADTLSQLMNQSGSSQSFGAGDFSLSLAQPLAGLPVIHRWITLGVPIAAGIMLIMFILGMVLGANWPSRLGWAGWTLIVLAIANSLAAVVFYVSKLAALGQVSAMVPGFSTSVFAPILRSLSNVVFDRFVEIEVMATSAMLVLGTICFIASRLINRPPSTAPAPLPASPMSQPSEAAGGSVTDQVPPATATAT